MRVVPVPRLRSPMEASVKYAIQAVTVIVCCICAIINGSTMGDAIRRGDWWVVAGTVVGMLMIATVQMLMLVMTDKMESSR